jgi:large subunit ribosomal protein L13
MYEKKPLDILRLAVRGMLPKNNLRDSRMKRLKLIKGTNHQYDHLDLIPLFND